MDVPQGHLTLDGIVADFARRERAMRNGARAAGVSRREFLEMLGAGALAVAAAGPLAAAEAAPPRSRVVLVRHPEVILRGYAVNPIIVRQMVDRAVGELTGARDLGRAWLQVARPDDFVALKYNGMNRPTLHSHTEINDAVTEALTGPAGLAKDRVLAVDRVLPPPYMELSEPFELPSRRLETRLRRLYTDKATAIVNVTVLKAHFTDGISACMKNHLGSVNNPSAYHGWQPGRMGHNLPELSNLPPLRTKTRLCILDAVRPLYAGGPSDNPEYRWDYRGLIVGLDPVAVTSVGLRILEAKREESLGKPWPMTAARDMVAYAQQIGLGQSDPARIDLVEIDMG